MRDPERIDDVLDIIRTYWKKHPDLRLTQIIGNALGEMSGEHYNLEDGELLDLLGAYAEHQVDCDWVTRRQWCRCPRRQP